MVAGPEEAQELLARRLAGPVAAEPWVQHVEHDPRIGRWYVRFGCDARDAATIVFDVHPRTLRYELYFLPDPPGDPLALYTWLLRRNHTAYGAHFSLGPDGDVYLVGRVLLEHLDDDGLDRVIGILYELVEVGFPTARRLAFGPPRPPPRRGAAG